MGIKSEIYKYIRQKSHMMYNRKPWKPITNHKEVHHGFQAPRVKPQRVGRERTFKKQALLERSDEQSVVRNKERIVKPLNVHHHPQVSSGESALDTLSLHLRALKAQVQLQELHTKLPINKSEKHRSSSFVATNNVPTAMSGRSVNHEAQFPALPHVVLPEDTGVSDNTLQHHPDPSSSRIPIPQHPSHPSS